MAPSEQQPAGTAVAGLAREVEEFVTAGGWDQPPQLFALVPTAALLDEQPELAGQLDPSSPLTPVAQEALPTGDLGEALATIAWPDLVLGCALAQEIIVLPPDAEAELPAESDAERLRQAAADHPRRTEARLVAAVLREGTTACVMRLRGLGGKSEGSEEAVDEIIENPELAPNLLDALKATFNP
ncbi:PPA1309 family protein [Amycolatopsis sp. H20-H5]|uniref:PPA1309 family protein n=1 Tax=Amycolatopsis sp. H20-H5 TaxID=3046309 RepID=UPI002DB5E543|nr:PPA1309 family protein [Amycolatopsis sp. H20-H5]MEC3978966.1 PPA1309 family protein [Amycolatopsis sp. H20-H5]